MYKNHPNSIKSAVKYTVVFILGFITNFSGALDNILSIPQSYKEFKKTYVYDGSSLAGKWSNNTEYLLGSGDLGLEGQSRLVMNLEANEHDEFHGEVLSTEICDALPLTWIISVESPEPGILSAFSKRKLYVKQLKNNQMEVVAVLEISSIDSRKGLIILEAVIDNFGIFPKTFALAKSLPAFEEDFEYLSSYCADSPKRAIEKYLGS